MRIKHLFFILFFVMIVFCLGWKQDNCAEKRAIYEIKTINNNETKTYLIYIQGYKWREETFENNSSKPLTVKIYDGKNLYTRSTHSGLPGYMFPVKFNDNSNIFKNTPFAVARKMNQSYQLTDWKKDNKEIFGKSITPVLIGEGKSKYGFNCKTYRYISTSINKDICVSDEQDMAVSIIEKTPSSESEVYLVKIKDEYNNKNLFTYFSLFNIEKK